MMRPVTAVCLGLLVTLSACTRFNTQTFLAKGFGHDLRPLLLGKEFVLGDGSLLVKDVTPADEIYKRFLAEEAEVKECSASVFEGLGLKVQASPDSPLRYRILHNGDAPMRVVTYQPATSTLAFLFLTGDRQKVLPGIQ